MQPYAKHLSGLASKHVNPTCYKTRSAVIFVANSPPLLPFEGHLSDREALPLASPGPDGAGDRRNRNGGPGALSTATAVVPAALSECTSTESRQNSEDWV